MSAETEIKIKGDAKGYLSALQQAANATRDAVGKIDGLDKKLVQVGAKMGDLGKTAGSVKQVATEIGGVVNQSVSASKGLGNMGLEGRKACKRLNAGLINTSAGIAAIGVSLAGVSAMVGKFGGALDAGDEMLKVTNRLKAFTGGASSAAAAAREVVEFARTPPFGLAETEKAAQLLLGVGVRASELKDTLTSLGNVAAGGGMSLEQMSIRLFKAFQTGKVTMEVLEPMINGGVNVMGALMAQTGKTEAELRRMMTTGKVGFNDLFIAIKKMGSEGGQFANGMADNTEGWRGALATVKGQLSEVTEEFARPISGAITEVMKDMSAEWQKSGPDVIKGFGEVGSVVGTVIKSVSPVVMTLGKGMAYVAGSSDMVAKSIRGIIFAYAGWKTVSLIGNSAIGQSIRGMAMMWRGEYVKELAVAGGHTKRFDSTIRASHTMMKSGWKGVGSAMSSAMKGTGVLLLVSGVAMAIQKIYELLTAANKLKEFQNENNREGEDFRDRNMKTAKRATSKLDVSHLADEYDAEMKRLERAMEDEGDLRRNDVLGERWAALHDEKKEMMALAEQNVKLARSRERAAASGLAEEAARADIYSKIKAAQEGIEELEFERNQSVADKKRSRMALGDQRSSLLGNFGGVGDILKEIQAQKERIASGGALDGIVNVDGIEGRIKYLYELLGKVEELDEKIALERKDKGAMEGAYNRRMEMLRAELTGQREKLRLMQDENELRARAMKYKGQGFSEAQASGMAKNEMDLEKSLDRKKSNRGYRVQMALLTAQLQGNEAEERRIRLLERQRELYEQMRAGGMSEEEAMAKSGAQSGLESAVSAKKSGKGIARQVDSLASVGGGGRSMIGSIPQLTEAKKQTSLLQKIVNNTRKSGQSGGDLVWAD